MGPCTSGQSKPTLAARFCNLAARLNAGKFRGTSSNKPSAPFAERSCCLMASQRCLTCEGVSPVVEARLCKVPGSEEHTSELQSRGQLVCPVLPTPRLHLLSLHDALPI